MNKKQKKILIRIIISAAITVGLFFMPDVGIYKLLLFLIPYFIAGFDIIFKAIKGLIRFQPFNENFLMVFATIGAFVLGEYTEGCAVMIFYQIGELFQKIAVGKSRKSISKLLDLRPDSARVESADGSIVSVAPEEVEVGSVLVIRAGEKVPIDGIVIDGSTSLNLSALTGESIPKDVSVDDEVISGSLNLTCVIKIKTTKKFGESTVSKILELVENATSKKSKSENFISKFAKYYTPIVCISAVVVAVVPPLIRIAMGLLPFWGDWVYRALTFLVISCPCALVISIPLGFFAGIGGAGSVGVLIKGSNYLEVLSKVKCVVFDKTGTVTKGEFAVVGVLNENIDAETLIEIVAAAESFSSHPISKSIVKAYGKKIDNFKVCDIIELSGYGVKAIVDGKTVYAGNDKLMEEICVPYKKCNHVETVVYVAIDGVYSGCILVSDTLKPQAAEAVAELKKQGVKKIAMLTGDTKIVAADTAKKLGIDEVYGELLPQDKVEKIEELLKDVCSGEKLAFVGDGINDAPALMRSDVGIAMGGVGSDSAIEAADVVLMDDNPARIPKAIKIARKCMKIVYQNIVFALGVKFICLLLGLLGITNMWLAIFADVGVMVLATLNAIRALYVKKI